MARGAIQIHVRSRQLAYVAGGGALIGRGMPMGVMTDVGGLLPLFVRAVGSRCSPRELQRQQNHDGDDQPSAHDPAIVWAQWGSLVVPSIKLLAPQGVVQVLLGTLSGTSWPACAHSLRSLKA